MSDVDPNAGEMEEGLAEEADQVEDEDVVLHAKEGEEEWLENLVLLLFTTITLVIKCVLVLGTSSIVVQ